MLIKFFIVFRCKYKISTLTLVFDLEIRNFNCLTPRKYIGNEKINSFKIKSTVN